jgi:hypothetical protein
MNLANVFSVFFEAASELYPVRFAFHWSVSKSTVFLSASWIFTLFIRFGATYLIPGALDPVLEALRLLENRENAASA